MATTLIPIIPILIAITHIPMVIMVLERGVQVTGVMGEGVTMVLGVRVTGVMVDEVITVLGVQVTGVIRGIADKTLRLTSKQKGDYQRFWFV